MEHNRYPTIEIKPALICFWLADKLMLPFAPYLQKAVYWCKYQYYKIPKANIIKMFDDYAEIFDDHLLNTLEYKTPIDLANFLTSNVKLDHNIGIMADLGCGTGLVGQELKKYFNIERLIGVDLSWQMLKRSKSRAIYNELHNSDILEYLKNSSPSKFDLITSIDVLVYIGDLSAIIKEVYKSLKPGGYFAFSVESHSDEKLNLNSFFRYQHSLKYLQELSQSNAFKNFFSIEVDLRKENKKFVPGYIVAMQK